MSIMAVEGIHPAQGRGNGRRCMNTPVSGRCDFSVGCGLLVEGGIQHGYHDHGQQGRECEAENDGNRHGDEESVEQ